MKRVIVCLAFLLLALFLTSPPSLAQGLDNLVRLKPGASVYQMSSLQLTDPDKPLNSSWQWKFATTTEGGPFVFRAFDKNCGVDVVQLLGPMGDQNDPVKGLVYLGDFELVGDQATRLRLTIENHLFRYSIDRGELVKVFSCLVKWDAPSFIARADDFYFKTAESGVTSCQDKIFFYGKSASLGNRQAAFLLSKALEAGQKVGTDCQYVRWSNYQASYQDSAPVKPVTGIASVQTPIPIPTVVVYQTVVVERVVTTTPVKTAIPTPTDNPIPTVTPIPTRKPGEKDLGEQLFGVFVSLICTLLTIVFLAIVVIIVIRQWQENNIKAKEYRLASEREFARREEEKLKEYLSTLQELEQILSREQIDEEDYEKADLLIKIAKDLKSRDPQGLAAGQLKVSDFEKRFRQKTTKIEK